MISGEQLVKCLYPVKKTRKNKGVLLKYEHRCGQCLPCRITRKQEWLLRMILESKCHTYNTFITLTYAEDQRTPEKSLAKVEAQKFLKRLRKNSGIHFRYFMVGEYGTSGVRGENEHYHAILFGYPPWLDEPIHNSWKKGFVDIQEVNSSAIAYVLGYTLKKMTQKDSYENKEPEFAIMSRGRKDGPWKGGIGYPYLKNFAENAIRDRINLVGDDFRYLRVSGFLLPLDAYMRKKLNKLIGYEKLDQTFSQRLVLSMKDYYDLNYPEAENDKKARSARKAKRKLFLQKAVKKL
jgi:hypothetical protein